MKNPSGKPLQPTALQQALLRLRSGFVSVAVFSFFLNLLMLATPLYMLSVYQRVLGSGHHETLLYLTIATVFALLILGALYSVRGWLLSRIGAWLNAELSGQVLSASLTNTLSGSPAGTQPLRDLGKVQGFVGGQGLATLLDSPWVPVFVLVIWIMHPALGVLALCSALLLLLLALLNELLLRAPQQEASNTQGQALQLADSLLRNAEVVQAMGMMNNLQARWQGVNTSGLGVQDKVDSRAAIILGLSRFLRLSAQVGVLGLGAYLVLAGELSAGHMIAGAILLGRALAPVEQAMGAWRGFVGARASYGRLQQLLAPPPQDWEPIQMPEGKGIIQVENLTFLSPTTHKPILHNVSFRLDPGESMSIIGPSASGKTTLCRMLVGVWPPSSGYARLDSAEVHHWDREDFASRVGYVPQCLELFAGSVRQNIARMGECSDAEVIAAAQLAEVHDMILHLPEGYDTEIGANGAILSAGQRQRVALARALFGNPQVVIMDEPNANLDRFGDAALVRVLAALKARGTSVIMVIHQANMLEHVDKVLMLRNGKAEAFGPTKDIVSVYSGQGGGDAGKGPRKVSRRIGSAPQKPPTSER